MKTPHLSIITSIIGILTLSIILLVPQTILGIPQSYNPTLEDQLGNSTKIKLAYDGSLLILNQTTSKLVYKSGENITIIPELINTGNKTVDIAYLEPEFFLEIKNQTGYVVWPQHTVIGWIPEFSGIKTLKPGEHFGAQPWGVTLGQDYFPHAIKLLVPGNYTATSVGLFTFDTTHSVTADKLEPVWSKPIQITVIPEFPFAILILLISITSLIVFHRIKFR